MACIKPPARVTARVPSTGPTLVARPALTPNQIKDFELRASLPQELPAGLKVTNRIDLTLDEVNPTTLKPETAYVYEKSVYVTDEHGHTAYVHGELRLVENSHSLRSKKGMQTKASAAAGGATNGYHGGHLIGLDLGGHPTGPNLFAQQQHFNQALFRVFEREAKAALKNGVKVELEVRIFDESPGDAVPDGLILNYTIGEVAMPEIVLMNIAEQLGNNPAEDTRRPSIMTPGPE
ncbi:hypothetical protein E3O45_02640 [Cryobacterium sp. TMS1-20-1]|uniref:DNA/RNA non-specific endonuclease n=1 Tax=Cryobacterium sp. TMS1-20-1 TaxID=1259223 RepID=UPI00106A7131|nr:DNA/RNA non-specific endonuclease [Cryobacterium sp. TMS1-20-1]TFC80058.1 hypothetical protein E3O45_02640 [Cryobacterium sp. TMS1-20-1]